MQHPLINDQGAFLKTNPGIMIQNIYFIDIEAVPQYRHLLDAPDIIQQLYNKRFRHAAHNDGISIERHYDENAGLYAEFGKVICISIGKLQGTKLYVKSLCGKDEKVILNQFAIMIKDRNINVLCAHNGKEFDFTYLFRRFIIQKIKVPAVLNRTNKKTWDPGLEDTMDMWAGSQWKYKCSADLLCHLFGIESPKLDMTGADVSNVYYEMFDTAKDELPFDKEEKALKRIAEYCNRDVVAEVDIYAMINQVDSYTEIEYL